MIAEWQQFLLGRAADWNVPQRDRWTCLFHNNYHPHCSSINLFWFYGGATSPRVVTKLQREPMLLRREFDGLQRAHASAPRFVPRPLHFGQIQDFWTLWMEGVPGTRFQIEEHRSPDALESAADAIIGFHAGVRESNAYPDSERWRRMVSEPLDTVSRFGTSSVVQKGCSALAAAISPEWLASLPVIPQHGDLFSENLLSHRDQYYIVDWETFGLIDLPLYDLLTFCLSLFPTETARPDQWPAWLLNQVPPLIHRYCDSLGLDYRNIRFLLPLTLVNWFHLQWSDGRRAFSERMYRTMERYFSAADLWDGLILPGAAGV